MLPPPRPPGGSAFLKLIPWLGAAFAVVNGLAWLIAWITGHAAAWGLTMISVKTNMTAAQVLAALGFVLLFPRTNPWRFS